MKTCILISSAGRRGALIQCFRESGRRLGIALEIVAADARPNLSAACQLADAQVAMPRCSESSYVRALLDECKRHAVCLIVPTIDPELRILSQHSEEFAQERIKIAVSGAECVDIASDKKLTAERLRAGGVSTPLSVSAHEFLVSPKSLLWPVILKPRGGSSSVGIVRPGTKAEADAACTAGEDLIVQELWGGREYTVNMYFDRTGTLRCAVPHWRIETRGGEVSKGRTEDILVLRDAAKRIAACLPGARGPLCFQAIVKDDGSYAVFEINARFGGGYPLAHRAGATFTQWLLEETLGLPCTANDHWRSGVTMLRYDEAVFLES